MDDFYSPNRSIDAAVRAMLLDFSKDSQRRMTKALRDAARAVENFRDENTDAGARHIFREFIPASLLNRLGYSFEYDCRIGGKTPDWYDADAAILMDSYTFERGGKSPFPQRVQSAVAEKCGKYNELICSLSLRFIVPVYLDFGTAILIEDCIAARQSFSETFSSNPNLWGIIFFTEGPGWGPGNQTYSFHCFASDDSYLNMARWKIPTERI